MNETDIVRQFFTGIGAGDASPPAGPGDDCALIEPPPGMRLVHSVDTSVAGVHFPPTLPPADVGWRSLAVALSDLAACGAAPDFFSLSLSVPKVDAHWMRQLADGLDECARRCGVRLVGGDLVKGQLSLSVQVGGWIEAGNFLSRAGAQAEQAVCVTVGPEDGCGLGCAAVGLRLLQGGDAAEMKLTQQQAEVCRRAFARPVPRLAEGKALCGLASACIDISDGLALDLHRLCESSGVAARLDSAAIPLGGPGNLRDLSDLSGPGALPNLCGAGEGLHRALHAGDEYQLCFAAPTHRLPELADRLGPEGQNWQRIGTFSSGAGLTLDGQPLQPQGWEHFND